MNLWQGNLLCILLYMEQHLAGETPDLGSWKAGNHLQAGSLVACPCVLVSVCPGQRLRLSTELMGWGLTCRAVLVLCLCVLQFCWAVFETIAWLLQVNQRPRRTGSQSSTPTGILRKWALEAWIKNSQIFSEELLLHEFSHLKLWNKWVSLTWRSVAGAQDAACPCCVRAGHSSHPCGALTQQCLRHPADQQSLFFPWSSQMYFGLLVLGWGRETNPTQTLSPEYGMSEGV